MPNDELEAMFFLFMCIAVCQVGPTLQRAGYRDLIEDWIARLCRGWFSPGKATRISHGKCPIGTIQYTKNIYTCIDLQTPGFDYVGR